MALVVQDENESMDFDTVGIPDAANLHIESLAGDRLLFPPGGEPAS